MELTNEQKTEISQWVKDGMSLSDIQKNIAKRFDLKPTFMEVRLLLMDLDVELKDERSNRPVEKIEKTTPPPAAQPSPNGPYAQNSTESPGLSEPQNAPAGPFADAAPQNPQTNVSVTLDTLQRPGYLVSGSVTFSDGVSATWALDQTGRLALEANQENYQPTQEDIQAFQIELKKQLEAKGM